ncbi:leucine-rich repeat domain-containing protein [Aeromonas caviae]|uniref:leucine-rich repeat domain-containing protein n=1 Tax=Aeromonas caviae TaxID=648 RepID=UPI002E7AD0E2|nr:leucine-rich repeat domain-containing protein [Aeromonas caviae]MEE1911533.1 leucine-rich repeat domain-containing protein [Aeromonas caviae]
MINNEKYFIDEVENGMGRCLVLTAPWSDSFKSIIDKENISVLRLSQSAGWNGNDISFINYLPSLSGVEIYSWGVKDITPLESISNLEYLGLQCEFTKAPDFSKLKKLKVLKVLWRPKAKTIFSCDELNLLNAVNYPSENLKELNKMSLLRHLQLTSKKIKSLSGIEELSSLSILDLADCPKLEDLSGIDKCQQIEIVEIENCKRVYDTAILSELKNLKEIVLIDCGTVKSLRPLAHSPSLESITFIGDTTIEDGELTSLLDIPTLKKMWFSNKRHYSHTREQVMEVLS